MSRWDHTNPSELAQAFQDADPQRRSWAVYHLGQQQREGILDMLLAACHDPDGMVRGFIIEALQNFTDPRLLDIYRAALEDVDWWVRFHAVAGMDFAHDEQGLRLVQQMLSDPVAAVRRQAVLATHQLQSAAVDILLPILDDPDATVVVAVIEVLSAIDTPPVQAAFLELWHRDIISSAGPALNVYLALVEGFERLRAVETLQMALQDSRWMSSNDWIDDWALRVNIIKALGRLKATSARALLVTFLRDPIEFRGHYPLQEAARTALSIIDEAQ